MRPLCWSNLKANWKRFHGDQSGLALIYVTVALPVLIGFSLLAIDVGRLSSLQSSLQHGADALALAGAGELDRRPDAIDRANHAIDNLVTTNQSLFATTVVTINSGDDIERHYLDAIPASDATPIDATWYAAHETADSTAARYVQIITDPTNFSTIFPVTFLGGGSNNAQTGAEAVAGMDQAVCKFTPMFICNPFEPLNSPEDPNQVYDDYGMYDYIKTVANRRRLILLKSQQNQWSPGNFGYLDSNLGNGNAGLAQEIVATSPKACFIQNNLATKTGNMNDLKKAFNVRFDMYANGNVPGNGDSWKDYPPAMNVRKGYTITPKNNGNPGDACTDAVPAAATDAIGFPHDPCFSATCNYNASGRIGDGDWDFQTYWDVNFNHPVGTYPAPLDPNDVPYSNSNRPTRYDIYRYEIEHNPDLNNIGQLLKVTSTGPAAAPEVGLPKCVTASVAIPDRRIIYGAIVNCGASGLSHGKTSGLQAVAFGKLFMTNPMEVTGAGINEQATLWTEIVDIVQPGSANSVSRDMVQLYR